MDHEPHQIPDNDDKPDELDRLTDQAGSYDEARIWLGVAEIRAAEQQATARNTELDNENNGHKMSPARRRRAGRAAVGPQYGNDELPVADQSRSSAEYDQLRAHVRPLADALFEASIERARAKAVQDGTNPGAIERAMREKRAKQQNR